MTHIPIPRELVERAPTLYGITSDIKDINTLLIPRSALTQQAEPARPCGHHPSLMLHSAETGEPLYCELCDDKSGRKDAELRETELAEANRVLREELAAQPSGEVLTDVRTHITAAMDNDLGWADRMLQMDKARKLIDATLAKIGAK